MAAGASITPWVSKEIFLGITWGGEAIGSLFVALRLLIRLKSFKKMFADDYFVISAWICSMAGCIIWQSFVKAMYDQYKLTTGDLIPTPEVLQRERGFLRGTVAFLYMFHTCLYCIKASFLIFFRRLDSRCEGPRKKWWWFVAAVTLAAYLTSLFTVQYKCLLGPFDYIFTQCSGAASLAWEHQVFSYQCAIDVITDSMIITIPIVMLWNVRVSLRKKMALMSLFSLTVIVMGASITRVSVVPTKNKQADVSWLYLWHNIEMSVTLLVSSLASFRQLYVMRSQGTGYQRTKSSGTSRSLRALFSGLRSQSHVISIPEAVHQPKNKEDDTLPLQEIHISHDISVATAPSRDTIETQDHEYRDFPAWQYQKQ